MYSKLSETLLKYYTSFIFVMHTFTFDTNTVTGSAR